MTTSRGAAQPSHATSRGAWASFVVVFLLYMLNYMDRNVMSAVAESVKLELGLSDKGLGAAGSVFLVCVAGFALPAAFVVDRWSRTKAIAAMAIAWSLATALTGFSSGLLSLLIARALVGIGESGFSAGGTAILSAAFPEEKRGRVLGLWNASIPLGGALGTVVGAVLAGHSGKWSTPFFAFCVPGVILAGCALLLRDYRARPSANASDGKNGDPTRFGESVRALFATRSLRFAYFAFAANMFITTSMLFWLPAWFARTYHLPIAVAGKRAALPMLLALVGAPVGGWIADRWSRRNPAGRALTCAVSSLLAAVFLAAALLLAGKPGGAPALYLWGLVAAAFSAPAAAITQDVVRPELRATSYGACVVCMYLLGGAWSPFLVGALSDRLGDVSQAMLILPIAGIIASALFYVSSRYYSADRSALASAEFARAAA